MQDTGNVTNPTAMQGHLQNGLFDFRHAALLTVFDKKRWRGTAWMLTAVPLFPLGREAMFHPVSVLTSRTTNLQAGHDELRHSAAKQRFGN